MPKRKRKIFGITVPDKISMYPRKITTVMLRFLDMMGYEWRSIYEYEYSNLRNLSIRSFPDPISLNIEFDKFNIKSRFSGYITKIKDEGIGMALLKRRKYHWRDCWLYACYSIPAFSSLYNINRKVEVPRDHYIPAKISTLALIDVRYLFGHFYNCMLRINNDARGTEFESGWNKICKSDNGVIKQSFLNDCVVLDNMLFSCKEIKTPTGFHITETMVKECDKARTSL